MKKVVLSLLMIGSIGILSQVQAQNWLEKVIVEKFYISNAADSVASANAGTGSLPVGSVTYRIFVDMMKGYKFESAYGSSTHELHFKTTTSFFNNEDRGSTTPNNNTRANDSTDYSLMVDSWLGDGFACKGYIAVPKSKDDGINTLKYSDNTIYKNTDTAAGIPLTTQDGMVKAPSTYKQQSVTTIGLDNVIEMLDASNISPATGQNLSVTDGAWSALSGAMGADTSNIVLIAQITTNGVFSYKLNIQIGDSSATTGNTQDFVADSANTSLGEITIPSLMGSFNPPPTSSAYPVCTVAAPAVTTTMQAVCTGKPFSAFTATGTATKWYGSDKTTVLATGTSYTPTTAGDYYVSQTIGCESPLTKVTATINTPPVITITATPDAIVTGASSVLLAGGGSSYIWNNSVTTTSQTVSPTATTTYTVTGTDGNGCSNTASLSLTVTSTPPSLSLSTSSTTIAASANSATTVTVSSNTTWTVSSDSTWLTVTPTSSKDTATLTLTATANPRGIPRTATITVSAAGVAPQTITVTQAAATPITTLSVTADTINATAGSTATVTITANLPWSAKSSDSWLTVSQNDTTGNGTITLTASANPNNATRKATVTITTASGSQTVTITQAAGATGFETIGNDDYTLYPNPASSSFSINTQEKVTVGIYTSSGTLVQQTTVVGKEHIATNSLQAGLYVVKIVTGEGTITRSLIISGN